MRPLLLAALLVSAVSCEKSKPAAVAEAAPSPPPAPSKRKDDLSGKAEVEFFGTWAAGEVKAARYIFVAQAEPCTPVPEKPTRYGEEKLGAPGPLFTELFITQGSKGYACIYGLDEAGKIVAAAGSTQNPMTFEGEGEVVISRLEFVLAAP